MQAGGYVAAVLAGNGYGGAVRRRRVCADFAGNRRGSGAVGGATNNEATHGRWRRTETFREHRGRRFSRGWANAERNLRSSGPRFIPRKGDSKEAIAAA